MKSTSHLDDRDLLERLRRKAGGLVVDSFFTGLSGAMRLTPLARPDLHGVERISDVPYDTAAPEQLLDVWVPRHVEPPYPVVLYIHGGGFRILSKDSHWVMALGFARRGFLVFNIDYRKAPRHPFPAAIDDACRAYRWVVDNASAYGGDLDRLVVAGESAGANLATGVTLAACYERPEPWAQRVYEAGCVPDAVAPACGILQVSDPQRFARRKQLPVWLVDRLEEVWEAYLAPADYRGPGGYEMADPLVLLERGEKPARALPPFFVPVGTRDPLLDDSRRLARALRALDTPCVERYYPGEIHAFHAFLWRANARQCWRDTYDFLQQCGCWGCAD